MTLTVTEGTIRGGADNFYLDNGTEGGEAVEGQLEFEEARLEEMMGSVRFDADLSGEVNGTGLSGGIDGAFFGEVAMGGPQYILGSGDGVVTEGEGTDVFGGFVVERDD